MRKVREEIGGLGNLMFKEAFLYSILLEGIIPDLYLQSSQYWGTHKDKIKQRFSYGIGDKTEPYVAVHIRRGDYLKAAQFHVALWDTTYYKEAVALFPNEKFLVFCKDNQDPQVDAADREWCVEFMTTLVGKDRFKMALTDTEETTDLNVMASCQGLIGANSSFSWWAAFLGNHKKIVMPKNWFTDGVQRTELLPDWTLL